MNRRKFLKWLGAGALSLLIPRHLRAKPTAPSPRLIRLQQDLHAIINTLEIGFDLRKVDPRDGYEYFRIQINAGKLYPVASCFKIFLALYYFWYTPRSEWSYDEDSPLYRVAVFSDNIMTSVVLDEVAQRTEAYGNAIQKFNDFLIFKLGLQNGLHRWDWKGSPVVDQTDDRFRPGEERLVEVHGAQYFMDNVMTAAELAGGYTRLLQPDPFPDVEYAQEMVAATLDLFSISAANYRSPIERAFASNYTGKDGVLPERDSAIGRVINDAGIVQVGNATYVLSYMCAGEGEYIAIQVLRQIAGAIAEYEHVT